MAEDIRERENNGESDLEQPVTEKSMQQGSAGTPEPDTVAETDATGTEDAASKTPSADGADSKPQTESQETPALKSQAPTTDATKPEGTDDTVTSAKATPGDFQDVDGFLLGEVVLKRQGENSLIPITCAICLERYEAGDSVVWSGNPLCSHGFHQECILDYLVHHDSEAAPCPCCRQIFLPMT